MSSQEPLRNYVYQPYGVKDLKDTDPKIYGIGGPDAFKLSISTGITKGEAQRLVDLLNGVYKR